MKKLATKQRVDSLVGGACVFILRFLSPLVGAVLRRDHDLRVGKDIVFTKFLGGGSLFVALPALLGLRRRYPETRFTFVTTPSLRPFADLSGIFDRVVVINDASVGTMIGSTIRAWWALLRVDTIVDLEVYSRASTVFSLCTMARNRIGFYLQNIYWRKYISTHLIFFNRSAGLYMFYDQISHFLGAVPASMAECREHLRTRLPTPPDSEGSLPRLSVGPFCSEFGRERMLTPDQWVVVLRRYVKLEGMEVHILGGPTDRVAGETMRAALAAAFPGTPVINDCGRWNLRETVSFIDGSDLFWGVDSALLHFSRLLGVESGSVWGPTDPTTRLRPVDGLTETVLYKRIFCSPCIHVAESPPCRGDNRCIRSLVDPSVTVDGRDAFTAWTPSDLRRKSA